MPIYGDDECEECGGIRVAKSTLCADCLVTRCRRLDEHLTIQREKIEELQEWNKTLFRQLEEALAYGFKQNQENMRVLKHSRGLEELMLRRLRDEKSRV